MKNNNRYVQPKNVREAMELIQNLFNQYRNQPLTQELLNYHIGLTNRLQTDIRVEAIKEGNEFQLKTLEGMVLAMQEWTKIRSSNLPFTAKMKNFKLTQNNSLKFKQHIHKIKGNHNYRGVKH